MSIVIQTRVYPSWFFRHLSFDLPDPTEHWPALVAFGEIGILTVVLGVFTNWGWALGVVTLWFLFGVAREPRPDEVLAFSFAISSLAAAAEFRWRKWAMKL